PERRHDDVVDQRVDDRREGGAEDDPDREVDDIAAHDKGPEFLPHAPLPLIRCPVASNCGLRDDSTTADLTPIGWDGVAWPRSRGAERTVTRCSCTTSC